MALTKVKSSMFDDVTAYGAVGNNSNDDAAAIQAAIDATPNGSVMKLGVGKTYYIGSRLVVDHPMTINAVGATIRFANGRGSGGFNNDALTITSSNVHIIGGTWKEVSSAAYGTGTHGIVFLGTENATGVAPTYIQNVSVRDATIESWENTSVLFAYCENFKFIDNDVKDVGYTAVQVRSSRYGIINDNSIGNLNPVGTYGDNAYGISLTLSDNGNTTERPITSNIVVSGNYVYDVKTWEGIDTHGGDTLTITSNTISNCRTGIAVVSYVGGASTAYDKGPTNVTVTGNTITNDLSEFDSDRTNLQRGIIVSGQVGSGGTAGTGVTVSGNKLDYCGGNVSNELLGAIAGQYLNNIVVSGNSISYAGSTGIFMTSCNNMTVDGNNIFGIDAYNAIEYPTATMTFSGNPTATDTFSLNGVTFTFTAGASAVNSNTAIDVQIGASLADTFANIASIFTTAKNTGTASVMPNGILSFITYSYDSSVFTWRYQYPTRMLGSNYVIAKSSSVITLSGANLSIPSDDQGAGILIDKLSGSYPVSSGVVSNNYIRNPSASGTAIRGISQIDDSEVIYKDNFMSGDGVLYDIEGSSVLTASSVDKLFENVITGLNLPSISAGAYIDVNIPYPSQQQPSLRITNLSFDRYLNGLNWSVQPQSGYGILRIFNPTSSAIDIASTSLSYSVCFGTTSSYDGYGSPS